MLPSLRLIVAGFLCGFVVVFAGLRMVASLHVVHAGLPIMAAHAATLPATGRYDPREPVPTPVLYDMRFVTGVVQPPPLNSPANVIERTFATAPPATDLVTQEPARKDLVDAPAVVVAATEPEPLVVALAPQSVPPSEPAPVAPVAIAPLEPIASPPPAAIAPEPATLAPPAKVAALPSEPAPEIVAAEPPSATAVPEADIPDLDGAPRTAATVTAPVEETKAAPVAAVRTARKKRPRVVRRAAGRAAAIQRHPPGTYVSSTGRWY